MEKFLKNRRFFNILLLISLAGFLLFPKISLADEFEDINLEEMEKYLELSGSDSEKLINSLRQVFTTESINLWGSGYSTDEEIAVNEILLEIIKGEVINYLLIDAPIEVSWKIIKGAIDIVRIYVDPSVSLEKLEKESVQRAIEYGMKFLLGKEIRITPGAIKFEYISNYGGENEVIFQYIMIYAPKDTKRGEVEIRFYSPNPIEPPNPQGFSRRLPVPNLEHNLPPFIVEIKGTVEKDKFDNYRWINEKGLITHPSVTIDFPPEVPDLGIKPLSIWERHFLKPITNTIREIEIIITKITGDGKIFEIPNISLDIWNEIKSFFSKLNPFGPAALVETPKDETSEPLTITETAEGIISEISPEETVEVEPRQIEPEPKEKLKEELKLTLEEIQEMLDDIAERIDVINQEVTKLVEVETDTEIEILELEKIIKETEEFEEILEIEESEEQIEQPEQIEEGEIILCEKTGEPTKNRVIINEVAWMGTTNSANDEWIELKNIFEAPINLAGWQLLDKDNQIKIIFGENEIISANGFFLLERTDDESIPNMVANLIYTGAFNNNQEALYLFDENCQTMDEIIANPDWPAGDNNSKRTMERKANFGWQTSVNTGGTPKNENSSGYIPYYGGGGYSPPPPAPAPISYPKILISEIQIEGQNSVKEDFVEFYNPNAENVDLTNWYIQRKTKNAANFSSYAPKSLFFGKVIESGDYFLIANASSSFSAEVTTTYPLTEDNTLVFKNPNGEIVDKVGWGEAQDYETATTSNPQAGESIGRKWSTTTQNYIDTDNNQNDFEIQSPTPGTKNQSPEPEPQPKSEELLLTVVINEIAWMGTNATNSADEWIELYNNTTSTIDLIGWTLKATDGTPSISFSTSTGTTTIPAQGFYLLERTDEQTVSDITADQIYTGPLGNGGEKLELRDASSTLIDVIDCSPGWFAGTTTSGYISMERINSTTTGATSTNWASNNLITRNGLNVNGDSIYGTPKSENSVSKSETEIPFPNLLPFDKFDELTFTYLGSPYIIGNALYVLEEKTLKIEPGVKVKFNPNWGTEIKGTLKAIGEENKKIIFTSSATPTYWGGIYFTASSSNSELEWTEIKYGRRTPQLGEPPAILVENSSIIFKNSTLENYTDRGLRLINSSSTIENVSFLGSGVTTSIVGIDIKGNSPTIKNSYFKDNKHGIFIDQGAFPTIEGNNFEENENPIYITYNSSFFPTFKNNQGNGNQTNVILIRGVISENSIWEVNSLPYFIHDFINLSENTNLTIKPGVIVKFNNGASLTINGTLLAQGTETEEIIFTGFSGTWKRIYFTASSTNSILENVEVSQGGGYYSQGQIYIEQSSIEINNSTSTGSAEAGLYLENSSSTITNSHFGNQQFGIKIYGSESFPQFETGLTFENNSVYDIFINNWGKWCSSLPGYLATSTNNNCP